MRLEIHSSEENQHEDEGTENADVSEVKEAEVAAEKIEGPEAVLEVVDNQKAEIEEQAKRKGYDGLLSRLSKKGRGFAGAVLLSLSAFASGCSKSPEAHPEIPSASPVAKVAEVEKVLHPVKVKKEITKRTPHRAHTDSAAEAEHGTPREKVKAEKEITAEKHREKKERAEIVKAEKHKKEKKIPKKEIAFAGELSTYINGAVIPQGEENFIVEMGGAKYRVAPQDAAALNTEYKRYKSVAKHSKKVNAVRENMTEAMKKIIERCPKIEAEETPGPEAKEL